jgi:hypothetical protein
MSESKLRGPSAVRTSPGRVAAIGAATAALVLSALAPAFAAGPPEKLLVANTGQAPGDLGDNAFIRSSRVEVGARPNGSFGSDIDAPVGWHPRDVDNSKSRLGFRYLRSGTWESGVTDGDFFLPGGPYEGWGVEIIGGTGLVGNSPDQTQIPGAFSLGTGAAEVVWTATGPVDGVGISKRYSVEVDGSPRLTMEVTFNNTTGSPVTALYFRGVDPDNCVEPGIADPDGPCSGVGYTTENEILSQRLAGGASSTVIARAPDGSALVLETFAERSVAFVGGLSDPYIGSAALLTATETSGFTTVDDFWADSANPLAVFTAVGEVETEDINIGLTATVEVPANGTATLTFFYSLSGDSGGTASVSTSHPMELVCSPDPVVVGGLVTCVITQGDPGIDILWRASYNPTVAEQGVTLDAEGRGTFTFRAPAGSQAQTITVELVEWDRTATVQVGGSAVPSRIPAGEGGTGVPLALGVVLVLVAGAGVLRMRRAGATV